MSQWFKTENGWEIEWWEHLIQIASFEPNQRFTVRFTSFDALTKDKVDGIVSEVLIIYEAGKETQNKKIRETLNIQ